MTWHLCCRFCIFCGRTGLCILTAGECNSECIHVRKEWTKFSRRVSVDHWTQRKVTIRAPVNDRGRYLNARKEWTEFSRRVSADHWTHTLSWGRRRILIYALHAARNPDQERVMIKWVRNWHLCRERQELGKIYHHHHDHPPATAVKSLNMHTFHYSFC